VFLSLPFLSLLRSAQWRRQSATDNQKKFVSNRWKKLDKETDGARDSKIAKLTKGEASNIITRIKHGAIVRVA
jgi:ATP-dependent helicase IRC3